MGRPKAPKRLVLTEAFLDHLAKALPERVVCGDPVVTLRVDVVRELIRMARFGKGLATIAAQSPEQRRAVAKRAIAARWARPDARARQSMATAEQWRRKRARNRPESDDRAMTQGDEARKDKGA